MRLKAMTEHFEKADYWIALGAGAYGLGVSHLATLLLAIPWWVKCTLQALFTLALSLGALTAQYFWRRYLRRRWPDPSDKSEGQ